MASLHHDHQGHDYLYVKGAPERILTMCSLQFSGDQTIPIDKTYWVKKIDSLAKQGKRVIGMAMKLTTTKHRDLSFDDVEKGLTMLALFGLVDLPHQEAISAVAECRSAGIRVKMITGDYSETAKSVATKLGLENCDRVLNGHELDALSIAELSRIVEDVDIYARTSPEHKLKLVAALQNNNQIVAMTGDGVNDALALKRANVGIAMGKKGTVAAKETASFLVQVTLVLITGFTLYYLE